MRGLGIIGSVCDKAEKVTLVFAISLNKQFFKNFLFSKSCFSLKSIVVILIILFEFISQ